MEWTTKCLFLSAGSRNLGSTLSNPNHLNLKPQLNLKLEAFPKPDPLKPTPSSYDDAAKVNQTTHCIICHRLWPRRLDTMNCPFLM